MIKYTYNKIYSFERLYYMNWFRRFMQGRYGVDQLAVAFIIVFILLNILSMIFPSVIIHIIYLLLFIYFVFRILSKNIAARQRENYTFLKFWRPVQHYFEQLAIRFKNRKHYKYFTCPDCKRKMRVPRGKGTVMVTCPGCGRKEKRQT